MTGASSVRDRRRADTVREIKEAASASSPRPGRAGCRCAGSPARSG